MLSLRRLGIPAFVGVLALTHAVAAHAQVTTGTIYGRVADSTGGVLPGATVTATNEQTAATRSTVTDGTGTFTLPFLPSGVYTVTIALEGFKTRTETGLSVNSGDKLRLAYRMELGQMNEVITVASETPLLNTTSAEEDVRVSDEMVTELPVANRDIMALLNQGTGLSVGSGSDRGNLAINGLPRYGMTFTIDGVDGTQDVERPSLSLFNNYHYIRGTSMEAVKEVEVSKNVFSAEIGMSVSGNVNIITKGGTNTFHGSGFFQAQNGSWDSADFISGETQPGTYKGYGGSLGGPIIPDKLFFFAAYEGYTEAREARFSGNVPSRQVRQTGVAVQPLSAGYWDLWPEPTGPEEPGDLQARFLGNFDQERDDNHVTARIDYNMSSEEFLSLRYSRSRPNELQPRLAIGNARTFEGISDIFAATYTRVLSSTVTTELRVGYNRNRTNRNDMIWTRQVIGLDITGVPDASGAAFMKFGDIWSIENTWSMVKGRHSLKFGALYRNLRASRFRENTPLYRYNSMADFAANLSSSAQFIFPLDEFEIRTFDAGVFVQDDFRLGNDLMLNLGIRWDYSGVPQERDDRIFNRVGPFGGADSANPGTIRYRNPDSIWEPNYNMISPRAGFAWTLNERTVLRGGFGVFFVPFNLYGGPVGMVQNGLGDPTRFSANGPQLIDLGVAYPMGNADVRPLVSSSECDKQNYTCPQDAVFESAWSTEVDRKNAFSLQWSLGLSRQLTDTLAWDVAYVGSNGRRLSYGPQNNRPDRVTGIAPVRNFGEFLYFGGHDSTVYNSLQTSLRRRFQNGIGFGIHYTYASNLGYYLSEVLGGGQDDQPQEINPTGHSQLDLSNNRGLTPYHNRHRLFADFIWELPLGEGPLGEGWQIGGLFEYTSGGSLRILDRGSLRGDRPDGLGDPFVDSCCEGDAPWQYLDPAAFARVPQTAAGYQERPGTLGRRGYTGPGYMRMDFNLAKRFRFDQLSFQLRAEVFNAFNHKNYNDPQQRIERSSFGQINGTAAPRVWQLGVRFDF